MRTLCINFEEKYRLASTEEVNVLTYKPIRDFFIFIGRCIAHKYAEDINPLRLIVSYEEETGHTPFTQLWEEMKPTLFGEKPEGTFIMELSTEYMTWLRLHKNGLYHQIYDTYYQGVVTCIPIDFIDLYRNSVYLLEEKILRDMSIYKKEFTHFSFTDKSLTALSPISRKIAFHMRKKYTPTTIVYKIVEDGKYGIKSIDGDIYIPCKYEDIDVFQCGVAVVRSNGKYGCININGDTVIPCEYDDIKGFHDNGLAIVERNGRYGCIHIDGEETIPCIYRYMDVHDIPHNGGEDAFWRWEKFTSKGEIATRCSFNESEKGFTCRLQEGLSIVNENNKYGFANAKLEVVIPCEYECAENFSEGLASVKKNGKWGCINLRGEEVIPFRFDGIGQFKDGIARVYENSMLYGLINNKGDMLLSCEYEYIYDFENGFATIQNRRDKFGLVNTSGEIVLPCMFDYVDDFHQGFTVLSQQKKYTCISMKGEVITPNDYDYIGRFSDGLAAVEQNGKWGYIDKHGKVIIPCKYERANPFISGIAAVRTTNEHRYINKNDELVEPLRLFDIENYDRYGRKEEGVFYAAIVVPYK